ncbi:asparaginase [Acidocella aminolytica]|uniref:L-asparaginase n=1 Tax=Acidocella aminolytica 101 = DSM 11237 TaxID=1120923 RepID=A0A0D6PC01_9PROT|nr:asparaginase [Acidocella aminolytica]GAN78891.1 L-asparaginase [Acidocella aminolytica 101 = DSM 11237]GBQ42301.1 L-asparaginase [Acidocella aminolytica 101 = DSM 11237]SHE98592.1 asparaginase [Acidocella aminolytica 101 = DSM 11237]
MSLNHTKPLVAVIATGGTIASQRGASGASAPTLTGQNLLAQMPRDKCQIRAIDLMAKDSASFTLNDIQQISEAVKIQLCDPEVAGVVVLHGTDAMEETALLVHLQYQLAKPVIFTGAQFTSDHIKSDGPGNLSGAIAAALCPEHARRGVLLHFASKLLPVWGTYKYSTERADAFRQSKRIDSLSSPRLDGDISKIRVDIVAVYPGCDHTHMQASLAAGANGIVLAALGSGNANPCLVEAVKDCTALDIPVVVSSRVPHGLLTSGYGGGGGGHDLAAAGAIHARILRPGQARILLLALLATGRDKEDIRAAFK